MQASIRVLLVLLMRRVRPSPRPVACELGEGRGEGEEAGVGELGAYQMALLEEGLTRICLF